MSLVGLAAAEQLAGPMQPVQKADRSEILSELQVVEVVELGGAREGEMVAWKTVNKAYE